MNIIKEVKKLNISRNDCIVVGGGILNQLGIRETSDVDLIVKPEIYESFRSLSGWVEKTWPKGAPTLLNGIYELGTDWGDDKHIYGFEEIDRQSIEIDGVKFVSLELLKKWKLAKGRDKDLRDVKLIDDYLVS
jgi:hypothetical protein